MILFFHYFITYIFDTEKKKRMEFKHKAVTVGQETLVIDYSTKARAAKGSSAFHVPHTSSHPNIWQWVDGHKLKILTPPWTGRVAFGGSSHWGHYKAVWEWKENGREAPWKELLQRRQGHPRRWMAAQPKLLPEKSTAVTSTL